MFYRAGFGVSPINTMLDRMEDGGPDAAEAPPPTIHDFLDEDDLLQECRSSNPRLVQYLCREEHLRLLIAFATTGRPPVECKKEPKAPPGSADSGSPEKRERMPNGRTTLEGLTSESSGKGRNTGTEGNDVKDADNGEDKARTKAVEDEEVDEKMGGVGDQKSRFTVKEDTGMRGGMSTSSGADEYVEQGNYLERMRLVDVDAKLRFKYPYVCTEVLSAEVTPLTDTILSSDELCDRLFSHIEHCPVGALDPTLAAQFAKVIISFLKTRNTEIVNKMARRGLLLQSMLKHLYLTPITELIVRILDPPVIERSYQPAASPPSGGALGLLSSHKILEKLANCFTDSLSYTGEIEQRRSEDTMSNAVLALHSITHRILRLPHLAVDIPPDLSPYERPEVVTALLDAGLEKLQENQTPFLLALNLASELLTTESNVKQEYDVLDPPKVPQLNPAFLGRGRRPPLGAALGLPPNLPTGVTGAPTMQQRRFSFHTSANPRNEDEPQEEEEEASSTVKRAPSPVDSLPVGAPLVSSVKLEDFLKKRFSVLASMLGETKRVSGPLGSVRLKVAEFFVACVKVGCGSTVAEITALDIPRKLLDLFLAYKWSSMLHGVIAKSIITALEQSEAVRGPHAARAWLKAGVIPWLMKAWKEESRTDQRFRAGYMGHLIQIGGALQTFLEKHLKISSAESMQEKDGAEKDEAKDEAKGEEEKEDKNEEKNEAKTELQDEAKDDIELSPLILGRLASEFELEQKSVEEFYKFCGESLAPVIQVEVTPLCDGDPRPGSDNEEYFEEPTEVFDMSDVIDGLTKGDANAAIEQFSQYLLSRSRSDGIIEEEEAVVVDTDLSHFADDEDEEEPSVGGNDRVRKFMEDYEVGEAPRSGKSGDFGGSRIHGGWKENHAFSSRDEESGMKDRSDKSGVAMLESIDETHAIATIDSSDEEDDEGTYEAFVAEKFEEQDLGKHFEKSLRLDSEKLGKDKARVDVNEAVTEIEEPAPITKEAEQSIASHVLRRIVDDDTEESSEEDDEDDEDWVEFSEVVDRNGLALGTEETQGTT